MNRARRWTLFLAVATLSLLIVASFAPPSSSRNLPDPLSPQGKSSDAKTQTNQTKTTKKGRDEIRIPATERNDPDQEVEDDDDPDLPPGMAGKINKEDYLRARAEYIDMLRGRLSQVPAGAREKAILQMENQKSLLRR